MIAGTDQIKNAMLLRDAMCAERVWWKIQRNVVIVTNVVTNHVLVNVLISLSIWTLCISVFMTNKLVEYVDLHVGIEVADIYYLECPVCIKLTYVLSRPWFKFRCFLLLVYL